MESDDSIRNFIQSRNWGFIAGLKGICCYLQCLVATYNGSVPLTTESSCPSPVKNLQCGGIKQKPLHPRCALTALRV